MILTTGIAMAMSGLVMASALLATTPACELLTEKEASKAIGLKMEQQGGAGDILHLSSCYWDAQDGGRLEFTLSEAGLFSPSGQTALDHYNGVVEGLTAAGEPFEALPGIGHGAVLMERDDVRFISMAAGGGYLSITLGESTREAIIAIAKIAAKRM